MLISQEDTYPAIVINTTILVCLFLKDLAENVEYNALAI